MSAAQEAYVICDKKTKVGRGFAFVSYVLPEDAQRAVATLNGSTFQGRKITVDSAKSRTEAAAAGVKKPQKLPTRPLRLMHRLHRLLHLLQLPRQALSHPSRSLVKAAR